MSATATYGAFPVRHAAGLPARVLANSALAFAVFLGGFVIFEPAPYELMLIAMLGFSVAFGMRIPRQLVPLLVMFILFNVGGVISSFQIADWQRGIQYVVTSLFLAATSVFFAIAILQEEGRLRIIFRAYVAAATITTILGLIGYFGVIPGFEIFTRYSRAMGAFQDPNVYGPFLVAPCLYLIYGIVHRSPTVAPIRIAVLLVLMLGLFLAFSRAAWGLFIITSMLFYLLLIINTPTARERLKFIVLAGIGALVLFLMVVVALHFDVVWDLFQQRFKAVQDYDAGRMGRFARHLAGYELALSKPFGIGPLEFGYIFGEDTHNNFVKALMDYGWLGFTCWMAINLWTMIAGFRLLFRPRPWLPYFQIAYVVFVGHFLIGNVIDTDHWRHFYLMIGIIWGCMALEWRWQRQRRVDASTLPVMAGSGHPGRHSRTSR